MSRIIQPVVSPRGRVIVLTGATLWLIASMVLSAMPEGASASVSDPGALTTTPVAVHDKVGDLDGMLAFPRIYTDSNGRVYIADKGNHRVVRLAEDGFRADVVYGREGAGPGELMYPRSVAVDSNGNVFVTDRQLQRLLKYAADGTFIRSIATPLVVSVVVDSHDRVIVRPGRGDALLERFTNDLEDDTVLLRHHESSHRTPLGTLVVADANDRLILLDQSDLTVRIYDAELRLVDEWAFDPPMLRDTVARRVEAGRIKNDGWTPPIDGVLSMSLFRQEFLVFTYFVIPEGAEKRQAKVAWYTVDGKRELIEDRGDELIFANATMPNGLVIEGTAEQVRIRVLGTITADVENN